MVLLEPAARAAAGRRFVTRRISIRIVIAKEKPPRVNSRDRKIRMFVMIRVISVPNTCCRARGEVVAPTARVGAKCLIGAATA